MFQSSNWRPLILVLCMCLVGAAPASAARIASSPRALVETLADPLQAGPLYVSVGPGNSTPRIVVPEGKSRMVRFDHAFREIVVGSRKIVHVITLSHHGIYVLGKKRGTTNLTLTDGRHRIVAVVDVVVSYDVDGLKRDLAKIVPNQNIDITPAGDALVLSGEVSDAGDLHKIVAIANRYAPKAVTNLLKVGGSQQVMLEVKFDEVERSALQNLGVGVLNANLFNKGTLSGTTARLPAALSEFGTIGGILTDLHSYQLRAKLQAMATKGLAHTLAEPNLVALTGQSASFLAGGEFPIPVVQSSTGTVPTTTIEYKDFGVGLSFTPTVIGADVVNLAIKSEVSAIDKTASVTTSGISVPGLKVRRARTTVEMRDGQTFAIAGLIQNDFQDTIDAVPGLGDVPILGALFRSSDFQHKQSELVVFITVHLVKPVDGKQLASPGDTVRRPTGAELDLLGKTGDTKPRAAGNNAGDSKSEGYVLP